MDRSFVLPLPRSLSLPRRIFTLPRRSAPVGRSRLLLGSAILAVALAAGGLVWLRGGAHVRHSHVTDNIPVAAVTIGGVRRALAADGSLLAPALLRGSLPIIDAPAADDIGTARLWGIPTLAELTVLAAAPPTLSGWIAHVYEGREGLTVAMRGGLLIYFGDGLRPHAKWLAVARVLADPSSAGAWYLDVRLPERPAAGLSGGTSGTVAGGSTGAAGAGKSGEVSATDPTAASLAESLAAAIGSSPTSAGSSPSSSPSTAGSPTSAAAAPSTGTAPSTGAAPSAGTPSTASSPTSESAPASGGSTGG